MLSYQFKLRQYVINCIQMNPTSHNKFSKTVTQFYFQPTHTNPLLQIKELTQLYKPRQFRIKNVHQISESFNTRKQKSLTNYQRLSQVIEAQQKVFRSSSSFINPEKAELDQSSKKLNNLLKSHILATQFQVRKKTKMIETIRNKGRENYQIMSNYRYFGNCVKKETQNLNQTRIKASLSFDIPKI